MKTRCAYPGRLTRPRAFSLIEMLVAAAVLLMMVLFVTQITDGASKSVVNSGRHMSADTQARMVFNRLALDFSRMLKRKDIDYSSFKQPVSTLPAPYVGAGGSPITFPANLQQPGNDRMAFYSETDGYFSGTPQPTGVQKSPVSLVAYRVDNDAHADTPGLLRMGRGLGWEPAASGNWVGVTYLPLTLSAQWPDLFTNTTDYKTVGDQVFRFEYSYLLKATPTRAAKLSITPWDVDAGHTSIDGFRDVAAIVVTLAIIDSTSRVLVGDYTALTEALPDAVDGQSVALAWNAKVSAPGFAVSVNLPAPAAAAVRVYERYFYLDSMQ